MLLLLYVEYSSPSTSAFIHLYPCSPYIQRMSTIILCHNIWTYIIHWVSWSPTVGHSSYIGSAGHLQPMYTWVRFILAPWGVCWPVPAPVQPNFTPRPPLQRRRCIQISCWRWPSLCQRHRGTVILRTCVQLARLGFLQCILVCCKGKPPLILLFLLPHPKLGIKSAAAPCAKVVITALAWCQFSAPMLGVVWARVAVRQCWVQAPRVINGQLLVVGVAVVGGASIAGIRAP